MPARLVGALSVSLSRWDVGVTQTPSPCMSCGAPAAHWGWMRQGDAGVLMHDVNSEPTPCPTGRAFDWETGEDLLAMASEAVAA